MSLFFKCKDLFSSYGEHKIQYRAKSWERRNSEIQEITVNFLPAIKYEVESLTLHVTSIIQGVRSFQLFINDQLKNSFSHNPTVTDDIDIDISSYLDSEEEESTEDPISSVNKFVLIAVMENGDQFQSNACYSSPILGLSGFGTGTLTRTDQAVGKTYSIDSSTKICTSDFDNLFPYNQFTEYTDEHGNEFVSIPSMWFRIGTDENNNITDIAVSEFPNGPERWIQTEAFKISRYKATLLDGVLGSVKNGSIVYNLSAGNLNEYLENLREQKGNEEDQYYFISFYYYTILLFLWAIEFGPDIKTGSIYSGISKTSLSSKEYLAGTENFTALATVGSSSGRMQYRGIEDFVGAGGEVLGGILSSTTLVAPHLNEMGELQGVLYSDASDNTFSYTSSDLYGYTVLSNSATVSVSYLGWDESLPFVSLPTSANNTGITGTTKSFYETSTINGITGAVIGQGFNFSLVNSLTNSNSLRTFRLILAHAPEEEITESTEDSTSTETTESE